MALRKLDISDGNLLLDDTLVGILATNPPEGVESSTEVSTEDSGVRINVKWTVKKKPDQVLPMEILKLRLGEFYPRAAFIGGREYEFTGVEPVRGAGLGFPYNTYYKFQMKASAGFDAAICSKMPIACWQEKHRAFAIVFPKELETSRERLPVFIRASGAEAVVDFSAAVFSEFQVTRKPFGWFGTGAERRKHIADFPEGQSFEASFLLVAADTWMDCVQACERHFYAALPDPVEPSTESLANTLSAALPFYDRVWDASNCTHVHLPVKNIPAFESVEFKHSHITDDVTKLVLYRRLIDSGYTSLAQRESRLLAKLLDGTYRYELDGASLWHTTTFFKGDGLKAFTHHGAGFVGFPGGMATVVRRLFEYVSCNPDSAVAETARSGSDWLADVQEDSGSWPATIRSMRRREHIGSIASTAESVRALVAAHVTTKEPRYRTAAETGLRFVNRDESFFLCRQYLRDVDPGEADGITAEACIHANLDWYALTRDEHALEQAKKWGLYAIQWIRPSSYDDNAEPSFDGLSRSITPRIDVWGELIIARAFLRLSRATGEASWRRHGWRLFLGVAELQERDGGLCETWFLDYPTGLESIHIEPTFVADAFVEFILDACSERGKDALAGQNSRRLTVLRRTFPPLGSVEAENDLITISEEGPEWVIDRKLRLVVAFEGPYSLAGELRHSTYSMLREVLVGRWLLKLVPAAKILFNRHCVVPPKSDIGRACPIKLTGFARNDNDQGVLGHRYRTSFHDITLSVTSAGLDPRGSPAADVELDLRTVAGDVRTGQVRIDLLGDYKILSFEDNDGLVVSSGGNDYFIQIVEGVTGGILNDGHRLAIDISLNSNWTFFGDYALKMRIARRSGNAGKTDS